MIDWIKNLFGFGDTGTSTAQNIQAGTPTTSINNQPTLNIDKDLESSRKVIVEEELSRPRRRRINKKRSNRRGKSSIRRALQWSNI